MRSFTSSKVFVGVFVAAAATAGLFSGIGKPHQKQIVPPPPVSRNESDNEPDYLDTINFMSSLRGWPFGTIDVKSYERAAYHSGPNAIDGGALWEFVGPKNNPGAGGIYNGPGPVSGRVNAIAFASFLPGAPMYIAAPTGGVHESRDGGTTWTPLSDAWDSMCTSCIAFNPNNSNIMLVGMGDYHGLRETGAIGIMKGTYAGGVWGWTIKGAAQIDTRAVSKVLFDPENPSIVLATTGRGGGITRNAGGTIIEEGKGRVLRSSDGGDTWSVVVGTAAPDQRPWNDVVCGAMSPATGRRIYYAVGNGTGNVLLRSNDKGRTWKPVAETPMGLAAGSFGGLDVATSPIDPETVYLLSSVDMRIWKSTNGGNKWAVLVSPDAQAGFPFNDPNTPNYNFSQRNYDWFIACGNHVDGISERPKDDVYVGLITIAHSPDGGLSWNDVGQTYTAGARTHNDQHCMAFKPGAGFTEPWLGNDGGLQRLTYNVGAGTFAFDQSKNRDLYITQFYHADWDGQTPQPDTILGGTQDNGSPWSNASPPSWQTNRNFGDGSGAAIGRGAANGHRTQYAGGYSSGATFSFQATNSWWIPDPGTDDCVFNGQPAVFFPPVTSDWNNPRYAYTASNRLWQYDIERSMVATTVTAPANNATQMVASTAGMFIGQVLAFYKYNNLTMQYVTGANYRTVVAIPNGTTVTLDAAINTAVGANEQWNVFGGRWAETTGHFDLNDRALSVRVAKADSFYIYVGTRDGHVYQSGDAGSTNGGWTDITGNLPADRPVSDIFTDPTNRNRVWITRQGASTAGRVCVSTAVGPVHTWTKFGAANGLPDVPANCICLDPDNPAMNIFVGTDMGLYYSKDAGATWQHANSVATSLMPSNVIVTDVEITGIGNDRILNVATFGRGIWRVAVASL